MYIYYISSINLIFFNSFPITTNINKYRHKYQNNIKQYQHHQQNPRYPRKLSNDNNKSWILRCRSPLSPRATHPWIPLAPLDT
ncbi:hypothetical protein BCR42DRAFT_414338 [Absidia repens]|uniref:Uncharacterized protein n=1 Tax=Absidia repens TaxID=90262 RepID=A0A1X2IKG4_9FUNG|nr:hypothetical protein BCR42DRAFT_414338 [Absidia repens]